MRSTPNASRVMKDWLAGELTDLAYPVALRQGVKGFSVDVELEIWRAINDALRGLPLRFLTRAFDSLPGWEEDTLARSTEAAYQVALRRGFRGAFVDLELSLWDTFHSRNGQLADLLRAYFYRIQQSLPS